MQEADETARAGVSCLLVRRAARCQNRREDEHLASWKERERESGRMAVLSPQPAPHFFVFSKGEKAVSAAPS